MKDVITFFIKRQLRIPRLCKQFNRLFHSRVIRKSSGSDSDLSDIIQDNNKSVIRPFQFAPILQHNRCFNTNTKEF